GDPVLAKGNLDEPIESTADNQLFPRLSAKAHQQDDGELVEGVDPHVIERVQDQRAQRLVLHQLIADLTQDLDDAVDILAVRDRDTGDRVGEILGQVLDARDLAEWKRVHRARHVAQADSANGDRLDHAFVVFADIDDVADRDLILEQDEETGNHILDERLTAEADRHTDNSRAGEQRGDVDADMGQHDQRGHDDDDAQQGRSQ